MAALALLGALVLSTDWSDVRVVPPPPIPDTKPIDHDAIEVARLDAERRLRNMAEAFGPDGRWNVERNVDHAAHWRWQMQQLERGD